MTLSSIVYVTPTGYFQKSGPRLVWGVEINDGTRTLTRCLADPFSDDEHDVCRWYLERYSQDSFDAPKANRAAFKLATYGERLAGQLKLSLSAGDSIDLVISEGPLAPGSATRTIHRLYWELLECSNAWGLETLDLRVRRVPGHYTGQHLPRSSLMPPESPKIIEILHVAARSRDRREVSPHMALAVLTQISHNLKRHNCPQRLKITTIRPGNFQKLKARLNQRRKQGRYDMFHLVHFDLHGDASPEKGARLLFEDDDDERLREVSSADVADALAGFPVPFMVLNACRSARADLGAEANTASVLIRRGCAESILAMSFDALSVAAETFLRVFYAEFLLRGASFASAARRGRRALQQDKARRGHLNRPLELNDWIVPVVYGSVQDLAIAPPVDLPEAAMETPLGGRVIGRDFSFGALEKFLLAHRRACLRGHAGIGKSMFLRYACRIWKETAFVDAVLWVDFASSSCRRRDSIVALLLCQLSLPLAGSTEESNRLLLSHVQDHAKILIIVDSLEAAFSACGSEAVPASTAVDMAAFLTQLCSACVEGKSGSMMLLSGRRAGLRSASPLNSGGDAIFGWLENSFQECTMELKGLDLGHSMELSENVLRDVGQAPRSVTDPDTRDALELLDRLFLGIPGAVDFVLRYAHDRALPWRDLRGRLLDGEPTIYEAFFGAMRSNKFFFELDHLWHTLPPQRLAPLLVLGIYWHQGPYNVRFSQAMVTFGVCDSQADAESSLELASEKRYIQSASYKRKLKRICFIHPLFSLFCRTTLQRLVHLVLSRGGSAYSGENNRPLSSGYYLLNAVRVYATVGLKDFESGLFDREFLNWFLHDVDYQRAYQQICHDEASSAATAFEIQVNPAAGHFLNTLSCFRLCLDRARATAPASWPLVHFALMAVHVMEARMAPEATLFADGYEQLLDRLVESKQTALQEPLLIYFFVITAGNLASLRKFHANASRDSRWRDHLKEARRQCGRLETTPWEPIALRVLSLLEADGNDPMSVASVLNTLPLQGFGTLFSDLPPDLSNLEPNVELADSAARGLLRSPELAQNIREQICGVPDSLIVQPSQMTDLDAFHEQATSLFSNLVQTRGEGPSNAPSLESQSAKLEGYFRSLQAMLPPQGLRLFTDRTTAWLINQPGVPTAESPGGERQLLQNLASAAFAAGDWAALRDAYATLSCYHLRRAELRQANEYLEELIRTLEADTSTGDDIEEFRRIQRVLVQNDAYRAMLAAEADHGAVGRTTTAGPEPAVGGTRLPAVDYETWELIRREFQELGPQIQLDATGLAATVHVGEQVTALFERIGEATANGAWDDALAAAAEMEELSGRDPVAHFIARGGLPMVRPLIEHERNTATSFRGWGESAASGRFGDARRHLERLEEVARGATAGPLREVLSPQDGKLAFLRWAQSVFEMHAASQALPEAGGGGGADGEDEAAVNELDGLLSRDETFFAHGRNLIGARFVEAMLSTAEWTRRKHLLRLAVAKGDTAAAENLRAQMNSSSPPARRVKTGLVWRLVRRVAVIFLVTLLRQVAFEGVKYLLGAVASRLWAFLILLGEWMGVDKGGIHT